MNKEIKTKGAEIHRFIVFFSFRASEILRFLSVRIREMALEKGDYWTMDPRSLEPFDPPAAQRLTEVVAPTLVLIGENDQAYLHETAQQLTAGIPGAKTKVLCGAGHLAHTVVPEVFNRTVLNFLKSLEL